MKKASLLLFLVALFFGALTYYFMYHADGGADGLSNFIPLILFGVLFLCILLAFLISLMPRKEGSSRRKWLIGIMVALPILGFLSVSGVFSYFTMDYQVKHKEQVELNKMVLETLHFKDEDFGVEFDHISGNVTTYMNEQPIPTPITPQIENGVLLVPVDDESYMQPDVLLKIERSSNEELSDFLDGLKEKVQLPEAKFKKVSPRAFSRFPDDIEIWEAKNPQVSYQDRLKLAQYFLSEKEAFPELIYFIKSPKHPSVIWVLMVANLISGTPASVEKLSTSNFEDYNLWFQTLEFVD